MIYTSYLRPAIFSACLCLFTAVLWARTPDRIRAELLKGITAIALNKGSIPGEVTVNLFSMYVLETVCGLSINNQHGAISPEGRHEKIERYFAEGPDFNRWKSDPFLALIMYI